MNITFPLKDHNFSEHSCVFCGSEAVLITPKYDAKWQSSNLFFRSLIVDLTGNVLSSGWPKFFNNGEKADLYPNPEHYQDWIIQEKLDGSLLIADWVNGQFSMRTRGCSSYMHQENFKDFDLLSSMHPSVQPFLEQHSHFSLLFEIVTPNNVIVIRPNAVKFYLIGAIDKRDLSVVSSSVLLDIWRSIGCVPMPTTYQIDNIKTLSLVSDLVKPWKAAEGVVISYSNNQHRVKVKSDWYLFAHRIKTELNSESNFIEYYVEAGMPSRVEFEDKIEKEFDFELAQLMSSQIVKICAAGKQTMLLIQQMKQFVSSIRKFDTRKQQAEYINLTYGKMNRSWFVFNLLDGKELSKLQLIKLVSQCL